MSMTMSATALLHLLQFATCTRSLRSGMRSCSGACWAPARCDDAAFAFWSECYLASRDTSEFRESVPEVVAFIRAQGLLDHHHGESS